MRLLAVKQKNLKELSLLINHLLLPEIDFSQLQLKPYYEQWLSDWLNKIESDLESGVVSTSLCLQGMLAEILLYRKYKTDWAGILQSYLVGESNEPLAYSEEYGKKLYKFNHWKQTAIHAIHMHWWAKRNLGASDRDLATYGNIVRKFIQPSGWIYNPQVSSTGVRTRIRSELMMSVAMGIEILSCEDSLRDYKVLFEGLLTSVPITGYLSAEYFRMRALGYLNSDHLAPVGIPEVIDMCQAGGGYCDFSLQSKVDDYMGTAKRVGRDQALHSAILSLYAGYLAMKSSGEVHKNVINRLREFANHLRSQPFDIQAFRMRDIEVPFGIDLSPLEIMAASYLVSERDN